MDNKEHKINDHQIELFAKNLRYYIDQSGKQQNEIAKDLNFPASTLNTWCVGKVMPKMGKVQALADYFGIKKSDLLEDKRDAEPDFTEFDVNLIRDFHSLDKRGQDAVHYTIRKEKERMDTEKELANKITSLEFENKHLKRNAVQASAYLSEDDVRYGADAAHARTDISVDEDDDDPYDDKIMNDENF